MKRISILLIISVFLLTSCATLGTLSPEETQLKARMTFNNLVEGYLIKYRTADLATQQKWKTEVDPVIKKAKTALDLWKVYLSLSDPTKAVEQQKIFMEFKDEILDLLVESFVEE